MNKKSKPPKYAEKLLVWFLKEELAEEVLGDLDEKYHKTTQEHNTQKAKRNYWYQVFNYLRPFAFKSTKVKNSISIPMKIHFKYTTRIFKKNSLITLASLASIVLGVLSSFLIYLWVESELTTDQFHSHYDELYLPMIQQGPGDTPRPFDVGLFFNTDYSQYSEVEKVINVITLLPERFILEYEKSEHRTKGIVSDSIFFDILDFELVRGDEATVLDDPSNMVISESLAKRIFNDVNPIGKAIKVGQYGLYQVAGILKDIPSNSTITFDYILPKHSKKLWDTSGVEFILVNDAFDKAAFNEKIKHDGRNHFQFKESIISVAPFSENYFENPLNSPLFSKTGDRFDIQTMILVAFIILIISALNFTNMQATLMLSLRKSKGIKKIHGARSIDFWYEIFSSRVIYAVLSIVIIFGIYELIKSNYSSFLSLTIDIPWYRELEMIVVGTLVFIGATTLLTVIQPTNIRASKSLIEKSAKSRNMYSGKALTTIQYVLAIALLIATGVVFKQFKYMQNKDLGFNSTNLLSARVFDKVIYQDDWDAFVAMSNEQRKQHEFFSNEIDKLPGVESFTQATLPMSKDVGSGSWKLANRNAEYEQIKFLSADPSYAKALGLEVIKGRWFTDSIDNPSTQRVVINRAAMEYWGIEDLENTKIASAVWGQEKKPWEIIGVVEDFHYEHLSRKIEPLIMASFEEIESEFTFRLQNQNFKETVSQISSVYQEIYPGKPFSYTLLENKLLDQYQYEKKLSQTFLLFTLIALMLSSLGLFTFALYDTQKRIKEIGIRKVIGASTRQVIQLLSSNFIKWVILAFVIALPISWYAMREWLSNFANRTSLDWRVFAMAGGMALMLALITVVGQSYSAANQNPVKALRHE